MEPLLTLLFLFLHFHSSLETREASSIHKVDSSPPGVPAEGASSIYLRVQFLTSENGVQCPSERGVSLHSSWGHLVYVSHSKAPCLPLAA